ncbi:MAG: hypothetical protein GY884_06820 [Proteobacteria bacterium]|nr:hypothetical protein [Pseudomonadota bacterium]
MLASTSSWSTWATSSSGHSSWPQRWASRSTSPSGSSSSSPSAPERRFRDGARVYSELASTLRTTGSSAELLHACYRALAALQAGDVAPDDPLWLMLRVRVGMEQLNRHQLPFVDEQLDLARPHLDRATWRPYRASFYVMEAWLAARRGENGQLQAALDGALAAFDSSTHPGSVAATVSYYLRRVGRLDEALALLDQVLPESSLQVADRSLGMVAQAREETGEARTTLACRGALGSLARAKGDYEGAMAHYEATRRAEAQLGVPHTITDANIAVLDVVRGRPIEATARFEALLDVPGLPAVLEVGAWIGVVLGWLVEGGSSRGAKGIRRCSSMRCSHGWARSGASPS